MQTLDNASAQEDENMSNRWVAFLAGSFLMMTTSAMATSFPSTVGYIYAPADASAQDPAIWPAGNPIAEFLVDNINFDSRRGDYTYDSFLSGGTGNPNNLQWLFWDTTSPYNKDSFYTAGGLGSFFVLYGEGYFQKNTPITHDDGFYLTLFQNQNSFTFDFSDPVSPKLDTLNNEAGIYQFEMRYGAWNGFPEVLIVDAGAAPVPEPSTFILLGGGIAGLVCLRRKRNA